MGTVLGGAAGLGARLTGSLHSIVEKLSRAIAPYGMQLSWYGSADGGALVDVRRGLQLTFREGFKEGGKQALRMLGAALGGLLLRPLDGLRRDGLDGFARGVATGAMSCILLPIAALLETGALVCLDCLDCLDLLDLLDLLDCLDCLDCLGCLDCLDCLDLLDLLGCLDCLDCLDSSSRGAGVP